MPVHRWLSACVHWPMLELTRGAGPPPSPTETAAAATTTATTTVSKRRWLLAVLATFLVSGVFHEAVVYVAMRGTCWPFNTFLLCVAGVLVTTWDLVFPPLQFRPARNAPVRSPSSAGGSEVSDKGRTDGGADAKVVRAYGDRGKASVFFFFVLLQLSAFIADSAAWLWWRHIHMKA